MKQQSRGCDDPFHLPDAIVDNTCCTCKSRLISNLSFQRENLLLKLCDNMLTRQRHSRIDIVRKHRQKPTPDAKHAFLVLLLRQMNWKSPPASSPRRHHANSTPNVFQQSVHVSFACQPSVATSELSSPSVQHNTTRLIPVHQRYANRALRCHDDIIL